MKKICCQLLLLSIAALISCGSPATVSNSPGPGKFKAALPQNREVNVDILPVFNWGKSDNADEYRLVIDTDVNFDKPFLLEEIVSGTSYTLTQELAYNTTYFWKVVAINGEGEKENTLAPYSFITEEDDVPQGRLPGAFNMVSTGTGITDEAEGLFSSSSIFVEWEQAGDPVEGGVNYHLYVSSDRYFDNIIIDIPGLLSTDSPYQIADLTALQTGKVYYWRVIAENSVWTTVKIVAANAPFSFNTFTPGEFDLLSPVHCAYGTGDMPTFEWETSNDAYTYTLEIAENDSFTGSTKFEDLQSETFTQDLSGMGDDLYWRVTAVNDAGETDSGSTYLLHKNPYDGIEDNTPDIVLYDPVVDGVEVLIDPITNVDYGIMDDIPSLVSFNDNYDPDIFVDRLKDFLDHFLKTYGPDGIGDNKDKFQEILRQLKGALQGDIDDPDPQIPIIALEVADMLDLYFHDENHIAIDSSFDLLDDVTGLESAAVKDSLNPILSLLRLTMNWDDLNTDELVNFPTETSAVSGHYWDFFSEGQELGDLGYDGMSDAIDMLESVIDTFQDSIDQGWDMTDSAASLRYAISEMQKDENDADPDNDIDDFIDDIIEYVDDAENYDTLGDGSKIFSLEKTAADWLAADPDKEYIVNFGIQELYPLLLNSEMSDALDGPADLLDGGRDIIDGAGRNLYGTPKSLSGDVSTDETLVIQHVLESASSDIELLDILDSLDIFDFDDTTLDLFQWLKDDIAGNFNAMLSLSGDNGITKSRLKELLWDGWEYDLPPGQGEPSENPQYRGLLTNDTIAGWDGHYGYVSAMSQPGMKSSDTVQKSYRLQMNDILNGDGDGDYYDDPAPESGEFKKFTDSYNLTSLTESAATNIYLGFLSDYYSIPDKKWALTPDDAELFFGQENRERNLQTRLGNIRLSFRNMIMHNRWGVDPSEPGPEEGCVKYNKKLEVGEFDCDNVTGYPEPGSGRDWTDGWVDLKKEKGSMLGELLFIAASSSGLVDKVAAPPLMTLNNSLTTMGSPLGEGGNTLNAGADDCVNIDVLVGIKPSALLGNNTIYRASYSVDAGQLDSNWVQYTTHREMSLMELQSGTFRERRVAAPCGTPIDAGESFDCVHSCTPDVGDWHGKFQQGQGDVIGIANEDGEPTGSRWSLTQSVLAGWSGFGPYTYRGKAANGSDSKYKNDWYSDWYQIRGQGGDGYGKYMGLGLWGMNSSSPREKEKGRLHIYEKIFRPDPATVEEDSAWDSGFTDRNGNIVAKYGITRVNREDGNYAGDWDGCDATCGGNTYDYSKATPKWLYGQFADNAYEAIPQVVQDRMVKIDCDSRTEAIFRNYQWFITQKKFQFIIPINLYQTFYLLGQNLWLEIYGFAIITANGLSGVSIARQYPGDASNDSEVYNGKWGLSGIDNNVAVSGYEDEDDDNYFIKCKAETEDNDFTCRHAGVSFTDSDYNNSMDYVWYTWHKPIIGSVRNDGGGLENILNTGADVAKIVLGQLGTFPSFAPVIGININTMAQLGTEVYRMKDVVSNGDQLDADITKFEPYYTVYFKDLNLKTHDADNMYRDINDSGGYDSGDVLVVAKDLPPVPKVNGVSYPDTYNPDGTVATWSTYNGYNKGKYEEVVELLVTSMGTMHDDGAVYKDFGSTGSDGLPVGTNPVASFTEIDSLDFRFYGNDSIRKHSINATMTMSALNEMVNDSAAGYFEPHYDENTDDADNPGLINTLVDHDPINDTIDPGSRKGLLPKLLDSKFLNLYDINPLYEGAEMALQHTFRKLFNSLELTTGHADDTLDLADYYNPDGTVNPGIDWDVPINRTRYLLDNNKLDVVEDALDLLKNMSGDARFVNFIKAGAKALNRFFIVRYIDSTLDDHPGLTREEVDTSGAYQIDVEDSDIDELLDNLRESDYEVLFNFVRDEKLTDLGRFYNMDFDEWRATLKPAVLSESLDLVNKMLIKYSDTNFKEGLIHGIYDINSDATGLPAGFEQGETVYGYGKYVEFDPQTDGNGNGTVELTDNDGPQAGDCNADCIIDGGADFGAGDIIIVDTSGVPGDRYFIYLDIKDWITNPANETKYAVESEGLASWTEIRHDDETVYSDTCYDYKDIWFRGGQDNEESPNILNVHIYDPDISKIMSEMEESTSEMVEADFAIGGGLDADGDPISMIDSLFNWNGSANAEWDIKADIFDYFKNELLEDVYDDSEITMMDPENNNVEITDTVRKVARIYIDYLRDNVFNYSWQLHTLKAEVWNGVNATFADTLNVGSSSIKENSLGLFVDGVFMDIDDKGGLITGDDIDPGGTNTINYATGVVNFTLLVPPVNGATVFVDYNLMDTTEFYQTGEAAGSHRHMLNNITEFIAIALNPDISKYMTADIGEVGMLEAIIYYLKELRDHDSFNISAEDLEQARDTAALLLYNDFDISELGTGDEVTVTFDGTLDTHLSTIRESTLEVKVNGIALDAGDSGSVISGSDIFAGSVDYATGVISITLGSAPLAGQKVEISYNHNSADYTRIATRAIYENDKATRILPNLLERFPNSDGDPKYNYGLILDILLNDNDTPEPEDDTGLLVDCTGAIEDCTGFLDYTMDNSEIGAEFTDFEVFSDLRTLFEMDVFRDYESHDSFWWQLGDLVEDISIHVEQ